MLNIVIWTISSLPIFPCIVPGCLLLVKCYTLYRYIADKTPTWFALGVRTWKSKVSTFIPDINVVFHNLPRCFQNIDFITTFRNTDLLPREITVLENLYGYQWQQCVVVSGTFFRVIGTLLTSFQHRLYITYQYCFSYSFLKHSP